VGEKDPEVIPSAAQFPHNAPELFSSIEARRLAKAEEFIDLRIFSQELGYRRPAHGSEARLRVGLFEVGEDRGSHDQISNPIGHPHNDISRF
jgi:hypothetical protein